LKKGNYYQTTNQTNSTKIQLFFSKTLQVGKEAGVKKKQKEFLEKFFNVRIKKRKKKRLLFFFPRDEFWIVCVNSWFFWPGNFGVFFLLGGGLFEKGRARFFWGKKTQFCGMGKKKIMIFPFGGMGKPPQKQQIQFLSIGKIFWSLHFFCPNKKKKGCFFSVGTVELA